MLRRVLKLLLTASVLFSCQSGKKDSVADYWSTHPYALDDDISVTEDRFAEFAERAVEAPVEEAVAALDDLFDHLKAEDEVAYYLYSEWARDVFYSPLSPCRNADLFSHIVERLETDGIFNEDECRPFRRQCDWMTLNREGSTAVIPEADPEGRSTLVLVVDLSCPSCHKALQELSEDAKWADCRHLALCCGRGPMPEVPGWEYRRVEDSNRYFDPLMMPVYYLIDPSGVVVQSYTPAH